MFSTTIVLTRRTFTMDEETEWSDMEVDLSILDELLKSEQAKGEEDISHHESAFASNEQFSLSDEEPLTGFIKEKDIISDVVESKFASREEFSSSDEETLATVKARTVQEPMNTRGHQLSESEIDVSNIKIAMLSDLFPNSSEQSESECTETFDSKDETPADPNCHDDSVSSECLISSGDEYVPPKEKNSEESDSKTNNEDTDELKEDFMRANMKRKRKIAAWDEKWKMKRSNIKLRKRKVAHRLSNTDKTDSDSEKRDTDAAQSTSRDLQSALKRSRKEHNLHILLTSIHNKRVDALLASNGLKRQPVRPDGNCFFESLALQFDGKSATELRAEICDHLDVEYDHCSKYMSIASGDGNDSDEDYSLGRYKSEVEDLRQAGHWSVSLADLIPSAVANLFKSKVIIYSSKPSQPVLELPPTIQGINAEVTFTFAHIAMKGKEHYDACKFDKISTTSASTKQDEKRTNKQQTPNKRKAKERSHPITPRKQAKFETPPKKKLTRKRHANPDTLKKNIRKKLRQSGKAYISATGQHVPARSMKGKDCSKCKFKCSEKISEGQRQKIFDAFWNLQSHDRQRDYICDHVLEKSTTGAKKKLARTFIFQVSGEIVRVCRSYFTSTLGIGRKTVECAFMRRSMSLTPVDKRGRRTPHNKTPDADLDTVRKHIEAFPRVESHYTRKDSNREYLNSDLSINKMYSLYKEEQQKKGKRAVKCKVYRTIFCEEHNLAFHKPKKDQCLLCTTYNQKKETTIDSAAGLQKAPRGKCKDEQRRARIS